MSISDILLRMPSAQRLSVESLPVQPLQRLIVPEEYADCVTDRELPIIYGGTTGELFSAAGTRCNVDIFGSAFFMLTRYEEVVKKDRDKWRYGCGCFLSSSLALVNKNWTQN